MIEEEAEDLSIALARWRPSLRFICPLESVHIGSGQSRRRTLGSVMQNNVSQWCGLLASSLILFLCSQMATIAIPSTAVLVLSLLPVSAHAQVACETPDTDFDGDDPDPCTPPAQVDPAATGPADSATIGPTQSSGGPTWNSAATQTWNSAPTPTWNIAPATPTQPTSGPTQCLKSGGCTTWAFEQMAVSLQLLDMPVGYT